jgi:hypothetical protein
MNVQNRWDSFKQRRGQSLGSPERGDGEDYDREDGEGEGETDELAERRPLVSEKQSKAEKGSELGRAELKPGDYQVLVNIIEVKDLIPLDLNGLTDPLVSVEVLKNKRFTKIKAGALSATFNELFTFNFDQLETGDLEAASIKITVYDADTFTSNDLVGAFSLSVPFVYAQPDHELHRQWLMLTDLRKADGDQSVDVSKPEITGKLRCSVAVLGANDKQKFHDELEDVKAELYRTDDDVNAALMPSFLAQKTAFLKLTIYRAEHLPVMDLKSVLSRFSGMNSGELTAPSAATDPDLYN